MSGRKIIYLKERLGIPPHIVVFLNWIPSVSYLPLPAHLQLSGESRADYEKILATSFITSDWRCTPML